MRLKMLNDQGTLFTCLFSGCVSVVKYKLALQPATGRTTFHKRYSFFCQRCSFILQLYIIFILPIVTHLFCFIHLLWISYCCSTFNCMALNSLYCAEVPLRNCWLTHSFHKWISVNMWIYLVPIRQSLMHQTTKISWWNPFVIFINTSVVVIHCCVLITGGWFHRYYRCHHHPRRCHWLRYQRKSVVSSLKLKWKLTTSCFSSRRPPLPSNNNNSSNRRCQIRRSTRPDLRLLVIRSTQRSDSLPTLASDSPTPASDYHILLIRISHSCIPMSD